MKKAALYAFIFPVCYIILMVFFLFNSGAGHDWGTGALFIASLPLAAIAIAFDSIFPGMGFDLLFPLLGLVQYVAIGYAIGAWVDRRSVSPP